MDFSNEPDTLTRYLPLKKPITIAGTEIDHIGFKHYCFDATLAPKGHSVATVLY